MAVRYMLDIGRRGRAAMASYRYTVTMRVAGVVELATDAPDDEIRAYVLDDACETIGIGVGEVCDLTYTREESD